MAGLSIIFALGFENPQDSPFTVGIYYIIIKYISTSIRDIYRNS